MLRAVPQVVPIKCPNCGANMSVRPQDEVVTCAYCNSSAFVKRPGRPSPPASPTRTYGPPPQFYVEVPQARGSAMAIVIALAIGGMIVMVSGAVAVIARSQGATAESRVDDPAAVAASRRRELAEKVAAAQQKASGIRPGGDHGRVPVQATNLSQVDPADLLRQAIEVARRVEPKSQLISAHFTELERGMLNLTGASKAFVVFEYRWQDTSKPAGKDLVEGSFYINADQGSFYTWARTDSATHLQDKGRARAFPLPLPGCTAKDAWVTATGTGVPANAISTVFWEKVSPFSGDQKAEWSFRVQGHDEYRREIDASNCRLLRRWDKG